MAHPSDTTTLTLLGLRLKGFGDAGAVAEIIGLDEATVTDELESARADDLALHREGGQVSGWALAPAGRAKGEELLSAELDACGSRDVVQGAYEDFLELNGRMLELCTDWQVIEGTEELNDHADADYDAKVIGRLEALGDELAPILDDLGTTLERYARYRPRFDAALEKLRGGDLDYFTKPIIPSYHTIWFELHEDLLATLGIDRASEQAAH